MYTEYTVQCISVLQIYTYSESTISLDTENIWSTLLNSLIQCCSVHWSIRVTLPSLYLLFNPIHIQEYCISVHRKCLEYTVKEPDTMLQCTLVFVEYTVWSISVHQISKYSGVKPLSMYAEHILSTQFTILSSL